MVFALVVSGSVVPKIPPDEDELTHRSFSDVAPDS